MFLGAALLCLTNPPAHAADVDFYRDVYPILKTNCIACHNKTTTKAALNMESPETMRKGGDSGEGVVPGKSTESLIYEAAAQTGDLEMPPKNNKTGAAKLKPEELALLKTWIDQGAKSSVKQARQVVWQPLPARMQPIYSVALTRDGRFAACGRANQIDVYDLATRQLVARLADDTLKPPAAHRAFVQSLAISPDGTKLASGSFREVKIWRRESAAVSSTKGDPALGAVISALSGDGHQVVCANKAGELHVVDSAMGKVIKTIPTGIAANITLLSVSPDATHAIVYVSDATLSLWSLASGVRIATKDGVAGVHTATWTRDGQAIITGGDDKVVRIWPRPTDGKAEFAAPKELSGATGAITALTSGPDSVIAASADGKVRVWNSAEGKPVREFPIAGVGALALSADGKQLATGRADGAVQIWDLATGKSLIELRGDAESNAQLAGLDWQVAAQALEASYQKQEVARIEAVNKAVDDRLKKVNETIANVRKELVEKDKALKSATEAKDAAQKAADAIAEQIAKAGKPDPALEKQQKDAQDKLTAATAAESMAMAAYKALEIHLKDAEFEAQNFMAAQAKNQSAIASANAAAAKAKEAQDKATADSAALKKAVAERSTPLLAVRFSADAQTVAAAFGDGSLRVWAIASGVPIEHVVGTAATALAASGDGGFIASAPDGSLARVSSSVRWVLERTLGGESATSPFVDRVNAVRFSPDGKTLAAGGGETTRSGDISLWDVATGQMIQEWKERHSDAVLSLDFSADGTRLASGGADKIARVTELASGKVVNIFEGHTHHVLGVSFRSDGRILATAGADGTVVVWDMLSGERKKKVEGWSKEVTSVQFIGATNQIVTSSGDNLVRIVDDNGGQVRAMPKTPDFLQSAASTPNAGALIGGGEDGLLHLWNGTNGQELATFGAVANARTP